MQFTVEGLLAWYTAYMDRHGLTATDMLSDLCRRFAYNYGFGRRRATQASSTQPGMEEQKAQFAAFFGKCMGHGRQTPIVNVDETGVCIDMPPRYILAEKGRSSAISKSEKNSGRLTAVLAIKSCGKYRHTALGQVVHV